MPELNQLEADEFARFFSLKDRGLVSYRTDGRILIRRLGDPNFRSYLVKKADVPLEDWIALKKEMLLRVARWCFETTELPSTEEMEEWVSDSVVDTPTGHRVEPDGVGPDGVPSWLRCLGLI